MELEKFTEDNLIGVVFKANDGIEYEIVEGKRNEVDFLYTKPTGESGRATDWGKGLVVLNLNSGDWKFIKRVNQEQTFNIWN